MLEDASPERREEVPPQVPPDMLQEVAPTATVVRLADERLWAAEERARRAESELRELKLKNDHVRFWHSLEKQIKSQQRAANARIAWSSNTNSAHRVPIFGMRCSTPDLRPAVAYGGSSAARPRTLLRAELENVESRRSSARWPSSITEPLSSEPTHCFRVGNALNRSTAPLDAEPAWRQQRPPGSARSRPAPRARASTARAAPTRPATVHSPRSINASPFPTTEQPQPYPTRSHPWLRAKAQPTYPVASRNQGQRAEGKSHAAFSRPTWQAPTSPRTAVESMGLRAAEGRVHRELLLSDRAVTAHAKPMRGHPPAGPAFESVLVANQMGWAPVAEPQ